MKYRTRINGRVVKEYLAYHSMLRRVRPTNPEDVERIKGTRYETMKVDDCFLGEGGYKTFYDEVGPCPDPDFVIDRIDNDEGYIKGNLRWASRRISNLNRSSAVMITAFGKTQNLSEWSRETGLSGIVIQYRLKTGWSVEDALSQPAHQGVIRS